MVDASRQDLLALLELQSIDTDIDRLTHRLRNLEEQAELELLTERHRALEAEVGELEAALDEVVLRQRKLDNEIELIGLKIDAEEARLNSGDVGSPRELSSLAAEVESLKRRRLRYEDDDLEVMEERENLDAEVTRRRGDLDSLQAEIAAATQRRDAAGGDVSRELELAKQRRGEWAPRIESELLAYYDDLRESKGGVAAAALQGSMCLGCHMQLPAQEVARVRASEGLVRCEDCGRILVVTDR